MEKQLIRFAGRKAMKHPVLLGYEGDNLVERLEFDLPEIAQGQTATLMITGADAVTLNRTDEGRYAVDLTMDMIGPDGEREAYIRIDGAGEKVWQSAPMRLTTGALPDVEEEIERVYPTAVGQMLTAMAEHSGEMEEQEERVEQAAQRAEDAAKRAEAGGGGSGSGGSAVETDTTLTQEGKAADAKATGDRLSELSKEIDRLNEENVCIRYGVDNTGVTDVSDVLQSIFDSAKHGQKLYFPSGVYLLSKGLVIKKRLTLMGDGDILSTEGDAATIFRFIDGTAGTLLTVERECRIYDILIDGNATTVQSDNNLMGIKEKSFPNTVTIHTEGVSGLHLKSYGIKAHGVTVIGCSEYGIHSDTFNTLVMCRVNNSKYGYYFRYDNTCMMLRSQCCQYGIVFDSSTTNTLTNVRLDEMQFNAIYYRGSAARNVISDLMVDQCGYSAIYVAPNASANSEKISGLVERCGQYYRGLTVDELVETGEPECSANVAILGTALYCDFDLAVDVGRANTYSKETFLFPTMNMYVNGGLTGNKISFSGIINKDNAECKQITDVSHLLYFFYPQLVNSSYPNVMHFNNQKYESRYITASTLDGRLHQVECDGVHYAASPNDRPIKTGGLAYINGVWYIASGNTNGSYTQITQAAN